jgi:hypothetical protein
VNADDDWFWEGVRDHRLLLQRCDGCGRLRHPPGPRCPACGSFEFSTVDASGRGRIYSWIVSRHPTEPDAHPRTVVLVELDEGVRLVSNLLADHGAEVGMRVEVTYADVDGVTRPQFRPVVDA